MPPLKGRGGTESCAALVARPLKGDTATKASTFQPPAEFGLQIEPRGWVRSVRQDRVSADLVEEESAAVELHRSADAWALIVRSWLLIIEGD